MGAGRVHMYRRGDNGHVSIGLAKPVISIGAAAIAVVVFTAVAAAPYLEARYRDKHAITRLSDHAYERAPDNDHAAAPNADQRLAL
ncbi:MAG: hypothetical protein AAF739_01865 [Pseudomonadota bacterium]